MFKPPIKTYSPEEIDRLLQLIVQYEIPVYDETTLGDMEVLIKHHLLKEYGHEVPRD